MTIEPVDIHSIPGDELAKQNDCVQEMVAEAMAADAKHGVVYCDNCGRQTMPSMCAMTMGKAPSFTCAGCYEGSGNLRARYDCKTGARLPKEPD